MKTFERNAQRFETVCFPIFKDFIFNFIFIFITPCIWRDASVEALVGKDV